MNQPDTTRQMVRLTSDVRQWIERRAARDPATMNTTILHPARAHGSRAGEGGALMIQNIEISSIRADTQAQPRTAILTDKIDEYIERMMAGDEFPPLVVFFDGQAYWLGDDFHRYHAAIDMQLANFPWWTDNEIARRCAVTHPFVGKLRASLVTVTSEEPSAPRTFTTKHGTTATMKTGNIGKRPSARTAVNGGVAA
jgi:hypothetical protein